MSTGRIKKRQLGELQKLALTVAGKIKIGYRHPEKGYPIALDHFLVDCQNNQYKNMIRDIYGDKPNLLKIVFMSNDFREVCNNYYELRDGQGKVFCKGDGETFEVAIKMGNRVIFKKFTEQDIIDRKGSVENFMNEALETVTTSKFKPEWKERLTLRFLIQGVPITGYWELVTFGKDSSIRLI